MVGTTNTSARQYTFLKLDDNNGSTKAYSAAYMPFIELMNTNPNIYITSGTLKFYSAQRIIMWANATFTRSTGEMWMSLRDGTSGTNLATAIDNNGSWCTLNFCTIIDATPSMALGMYMHDSGVTLRSDSAIGSPLRVSNIIILPL